MAKHSTAVVVIAFALAATVRASDSEFSAKMAAWQGGGSAAAPPVEGVPADIGSLTAPGLLYFARTG